MNGPWDLERTVLQLGDDTGRLAAAVESGDLSLPVAACPGWDVRRLATHVGSIHRWAAEAIRTGAAPDSGAPARPSPDAPADEVAAWLRLGSGILADLLAATPVDAPSWHPFPWAQTAGFWSRRQMMETAVHRWDAESAVLGASEIDPELATIGIVEYLELGLPHVLRRDGVVAPPGTLGIRRRDPGDVAPGAPGASGASGAGRAEWVARSEGGGVRLGRANGDGRDGDEPDGPPPDATLVGTADDVLLVLMGRADRERLDVEGDASVADAWLDLPGW